MLCSLCCAGPSKTVADVNSEPLNGEINEILSQVRDGLVMDRNMNEWPQRSKWPQRNEWQGAEYRTRQRCSAHGLQCRHMPCLPCDAPSPLLNPPRLPCTHLA